MRKDGRQNLSHQDSSASGLDSIREMHEDELIFGNFGDLLSNKAKNMTPEHKNEYIRDMIFNYRWVGICFQIENNHKRQFIFSSILIIYIYIIYIG